MVVLDFRRRLTTTKIPGGRRRTPRHASYKGLREKQDSAAAYEFITEELASRYASKPVSTWSSLHVVPRLVSALHDDLPSIMPPNWLVATMQIDIEGSGIAIHESTLNAINMWKLERGVVA